jgi:hypothetical protein
MQGVGWAGLGTLLMGLASVGLSSPRATAAPSGGFLVSVHTDVAGERRTLWMQAGGGAASLVLAAPTDYAGDDASGRAILMSPDGKQGGRFVEALAQGLALPAPAGKAPATRALPFYGSYVRLPPQGDWQRYRLTLAHGSSRADVLLETTADGNQARFLEADKAYRETLVALLTGALRDGFPRRTPKADTTLATAAPLWSTFQPVAGENDAAVHAWAANGGTWGAVTRAGSSKLVWWTALDHAPTEILEVDGQITAVSAAPKKRQAAVTIVHPSRPAPAGATAYAASDPVELRIVDAEVAAPVKLIAPGSQLDFTPSILWSPMGGSLAVVTLDEKEAHKQVLRVFDAADGHEIASTPLGLNSALLDWTSEGVFFSSTPSDTTTCYRWRPAQGGPVALPSPPDRRSPDNRYSFRLVEGGVEVVGPEGVVPFPTVFTEDRHALEYAASVRAWWLGSHQLLLVSDDLLVLDLATRKLRYLFPHDRSLLLQGASSDGRVVIARDENDHLVWARASESGAK